MSFAKIDSAIPKLIENRYVGFGFVNKKTYKRLKALMLAALRWVNVETQFSPRRKGLIYATSYGPLFIQIKRGVAPNTLQLYEYLGDRKPKVTVKL
jgi:hypothetical protein